MFMPIMPIILLVSLIFLQGNCMIHATDADQSETLVRGLSSGAPIDGEGFDLALKKIVNDTKVYVTEEGLMSQILQNDMAASFAAMRLWEKLRYEKSTRADRAQFIQTLKDRYKTGLVSIYRAASFRVLAYYDNAYVVKESKRILVEANVYESDLWPYCIDVVSAIPGEESEKFLVGILKSGKFRLMQDREKMVSAITRIERKVFSLHSVRYAIPYVIGTLDDGLLEEGILARRSSAIALLDRSIPVNGLAIRDCGYDKSIDRMKSLINSLNVWVVENMPAFDDRIIPLKMLSLRPAEPVRNPKINID